MHHVGDPTGRVTREGGESIVFDIEPIKVGDTERDMSDIEYAVWYVPDESISSLNGVHCVVREQFQIEFSHLKLSRRTWSQTTGGPWLIRSEIQVRHSNLANNAWTTMQTFDSEAHSNNILIPGHTVSRRSEWLEVHGEVRIRGTVEDGSGVTVAWFDQSRKIRVLPNPTASDGGPLTLDDHSPE